MKTLLLIDANSLIHRAFHALPPLTAKDGKPIQAIYGVASILLKIWREEKPDYAAALFDRPEPTFRDALSKEYKAHRPATPDTLIPQLVEAHELFLKFGVSVFEAPGFEADDLIATLATRFGDEPEARIVILTGDLDTLQLVRDEKIVVRALRTGVSDTVLYDTAMVKARYGLAPRQLIDYKSLVGDTSDNVKGVPGVGPKTAQAILQKFGTLEKALASADELTARKIVPFRKEIELAEELVRLRQDAPVPTRALSELIVRETEDELARYFEARGLETLRARLRGGPLPKKKPVSRAPKQQGTIFS